MHNIIKIIISYSLIFGLIGCTTQENHSPQADFKRFHHWDEVYGNDYIQATAFAMYGLESATNKYARIETMQNYLEEVDTIQASLNYLDIQNDEILPIKNIGLKALQLSQETFRDMIKLESQPDEARLNRFKIKGESLPN
ncbi:DNA repair protein [Actinobacillus equuli]|uniref:DNA repair protein n=1 Tax=Actinobacillus equuli TaxID=718 RepID=UPI002442D924|nr:DNA repair protein [Actinobacillus equuli]WGE60130.1 DNA repair protein [Actinobacillus equuli subsp. haemolyticus]